MLTAIHAPTGKQYFAPDSPELCHGQYKGTFVDPIVGKPCRFWSAHERKTTMGETKVTAHFKTTTGVLTDEDLKDVVVDTEYLTPVSGGYRIHESPIHENAKLYLKSIFSGVFREGIIQLEKRILLPCGRHRIADVAIWLPDGARVVLEAQISPIDFESLESRVLDYANLGLESIWYLGPKARNVSNMEFLREYASFTFINWS